MTREEALEVIKAQIKTALDDINVDEIDFDKPMKDYGANSLDIIEVVAGSMRELKIKVPRDELMKVETVNQLADKFVMHAAK